MPPKPKYTREQIASAAFELVRKNGVQALTARELGKAIGTEKDRANLRKRKTYSPGVEPMAPKIQS